MSACQLGHLAAASVSVFAVLSRLVLIALSRLWMISLVSSLDNSISPRHHHHQHRQHPNITTSSLSSPLPALPLPSLIPHPSSHSAPQHGTTVTDRFPVSWPPLSLQSCPHPPPSQQNQAPGCGWSPA
ncbi:hypothetical protein J3F84DRAFT_175547 [Trichoderma pleuroticola]